VPDVANGAALPDAYAALLGITAHGDGGGRAHASATVTERHLNPHGTAHGAFLFSLAGVALAAAANDAEHSGVVCAAHVDYLAPARAGDELTATARVAERLAGQDLFEVRVVRADGDLVARITARATRRPRA
jgi:acyl-CoA thioesterase